MPERRDEVDRKIQDWNSPYMWGDHPDSLAPYVPSPLNVVREMLTLAEVKPDDVVYDLGCGDGRILFTAVEEFGVRKAVGFEISPQMVEGLEKKIADKGVRDKISVRQENFMEADLSEATLVTIYLTTSGNAKLKPRLQEQLREGSRVVSHDFPVHGWTTVNEDGTPFSLGSHKMFIYRVPDCFRREPVVKRTPSEEDRWKRIQDMFTRVEKG